MSPEAKPTKPIDIYVRVSRTGGRDVEAEGGTAEDQERRCRAQLAADGLVAGEVFVDLDESGAKESRPQFDILMARVGDGVSGGVVTLNLKRFGRRLTVVRDILWVEEQGATFLSVEERIDTSTPSGRFMLTVFAGLATMELEERKDGWKRVTTNAVERGVHISSRVPAGYVRDPKTKVLALAPSAPAILAAFEARADGATWPEVAKILTDAGVPKSRDSDSPTWDEYAAAKLCQNRVYLGEARGASSGAPNKDAHPPIVSAGLFARVQARRGEAHSFVDPARRRELLAGLVRCGTCGSSMALHPSQRPNGDVYLAWQCSGGSTCKAKAGISVKKLEAYVLEYLVDQGAELPIEAPRSNDAAVAAAQRHLDNAQAALDDLTEAAAKRGLSVEDVLDLQVSYKRERDEAAVLLNEASGSGFDTERSWAEAWADGASEMSAEYEYKTQGPRWRHYTGTITGDQLVELLLGVNEENNTLARRMMRSLVEKITVTKSTTKGRAQVAERVTVELG